MVSLAGHPSAQLIELVGILDIDLQLSPNS
jgi:hypothetical protein